MRTVNTPGTAHSNQGLHSEYLIHLLTKQECKIYVFVTNLDVLSCHALWLYDKTGGAVVESWSTGNTTLAVMLQSSCV